MRSLHRVRLTMVIAVLLSSCLIDRHPLSFAAAPQQTSTPQPVYLPLVSSTQPAPTHRARLVKDLNPAFEESYFNPTDVTSTQGHLYFVARVGQGGNEVWSYDGSTATPLTTLNPVGNTTTIMNLATFGATLIFVVPNDSDYELWKSTGTMAGTARMTTLPKTSDGLPPRQFTAVGSTLYFVANDDHGAELWKTDGTAAGTARVADINPGAANSDPAELVAVGTTLFFSAYDGVHGDELWKSDGTAAGTVLVSDMHAGPEGSSLRELTPLNGTLFFFADVAIDYSQLWKSDGTAAGTARVSSVLGSQNGEDPQLHGLTVLSNTLFFATHTAFNNALYRSDGTSVGTSTVTFLATAPTDLVTAGSNVFFLVRRGFDADQPIDLWRSDGTLTGTIALTTTGYLTDKMMPLDNRIIFATNPIAQQPATSGLWVSDGTPAGTQRYSSLVPYYDISEATPPPSFVAFGNALFFTNNDSEQRSTLWKTDGTAPGTGQAIAPPHLGISSNPNLLAALGDGISFQAIPVNSYSGEMFKSNGTAVGTTPFNELRSGQLGDDFAQFADLQGGLLFLTTDYANGSQLWRTNRDFSNPTPLITIPSDNEQRFNLIITHNNLAYFTAFDAKVTALWKSDGTAAGTTRIKLLDNDKRQAYPNFLDLLGDTIIFSIDTASTVRLWHSDGSEAGTTQIKQFKRYPYGPDYPLQYVGTTQGKIVFTLVEETNGASIRLWATDGTAAGTERISTATPITYNDGQFNLFTVTNGYIYFLDYHESHIGIWRTDGTAKGTIFLQAISYTFDNSTNYHVQYEFIDNLLIFAFDDGNNGYHLWRTDGTTKGTFRLTDTVLAATGDAMGQFFRVGAVICIEATAPNHSRSLWRTDGSTKGTFHLVDFDANTLNNTVQTGHAVGTTLFFMLDNGQFWRTDGSVANTQRIPDIYPNDLNASHDLHIGNTLFFAATSGQGNELWKADGTSGQISLVKDICPGTCSASPTALTVINNTLLFAANDGTHGSELWQSDGTAAGTQLVDDLAPDSVSSSPAEPTLAGNQIFFSAFTPETGRELWVLPRAGISTMTASGSTTEHAPQRTHTQRTRGARRR